MIMNNTEYDLLSKEDFAAMFEATEDEINCLETKVNRLEDKVDDLQMEIADLEYELDELRMSC